MTHSICKKNYKTMTPGPTNVRENVRLARSLETTNPDLDPNFFSFYKETCEKLSSLVHTKNPAFILSGEGILGLEAACASLTEHGDRVLVIDNGVFGKGFGGFVEMYGGKVVYFTDDYHSGINVSKLKDFLEKDHDFKYATVIHCDTPSGVLNNVEDICKLLHYYNILSVVDSVAGMFGEAINVDLGKIDILCGGSQKALSAPPGLTMVWISDRAFNAMESRKTPIASYYCNLLVFKDYYKGERFPYTMPISDIIGLRVAIDNVMEDDNIFDRHKKIAEATRHAILESGLELYLDSDYSNTVTVIRVPQGMDCNLILSTMKKNYGIMIADSFDVLAGKVIRIGHMGENANSNDMIETLDALQKTLNELGFSQKKNMVESFTKYIEK